MEVEAKWRLCTSFVVGITWSKVEMQMYNHCVPQLLSKCSTNICIMSQLCSHSYLASQSRELEHMDGLIKHRGIV